MNRTGLIFGLMIAVVIVVTLAGCGGGSSGPKTPPVTTPRYGNERIFDDFSNVNSGWKTGGNNYCRYGYAKDGYVGYEMEILTPGKHYALAWRPEMFTKYKVWVDVTNLSHGYNPEYGLLFNYFDDGDEDKDDEGYVFSIIPEQRRFQIRKLNGDEWSLVHSDISDSINSTNGAVNTLEVSYISNAIEFRINGSEPVYTLSDFNSHPYYGEKIGLAVMNMVNGGTTAPFKVRFSNYNIVGDCVVNTIPATPTPGI